MVLLDSLPVPAVHLDDQGKILDYNLLATELAGLRRALCKGASFSSLLSVKDSRAFEQLLGELTYPVPAEITVDLADTSASPNRLLLKISAAEDGSRVLLLQANHQEAKDSPGRAHQDQKMMERQRIFHLAVLENVRDGIVACDRHGRICMMNREGRRLYLGDEDLPLPQTLAEIEHFTRLGEISIPLSKDPLTRLLEGKKLKNYEVEFEDREQNRHILRVNGQVMTDQDERILGAVISIHDITDLRETKKRLHHLAYHDVLTNLPNRRLFHDLLEQTLKQAQREGDRVGVLFLDIDNFKSINDRFGHSAGDRLLQQIGKGLKACLRESDILCRWGGDEFVIALPTGKDIAGFSLVAEKIRQTLLSSILDSFPKSSLSVSIGAAISPDHGSEPDLLIRNADIAMYEAKRAGKNRCQIFRPVDDPQAPNISLPN